MFKKRQIISVFEIDQRRIKLAQIQVGDKEKSLSKLATFEVRSDDESLIVKAIKKIALDYKVAGTRVIVSVQRHKVTVKKLTLPSTNPAEIDSMVSLQAAKQLPFSPEKIISGYRILGKDKKGYSSVMMALVHTDVVDKIVGLFDSAGLEIERLALSSEALSVWQGERRAEMGKDPCLCLVDIGRSSVEIQITKAGELDFTRSVVFSQSESMPERIQDEVRKSLYTFKKTAQGQDVKKLVLTGRWSLVKKEGPALKKGLGLPTVFIDSIKQWPKGADCQLPSRPQLEGDSFTSLIASGFYSDNLDINLIPQEMRLGRMSKIAKDNLIITATLALCIILGVTGIITKDFIEKNRYLSTVKKRLKESKPRVERLAKYKEMTDIIKRQTNIKGSSIDILRELYGAVPSNINLAILDYRDGDSCLLRGTADKLSEALKFVSLLEESAYFENVEVRYATKRAIGKRDLTDFEIICNLSKVDR